MTRKKRRWLKKSEESTQVSKNKLKLEGIDVVRIGKAGEIHVHVSLN